MNLPAETRALGHWAGNAKWLAPVAGLVIVGAFFQIKSPAFLESTNLRFIAAQTVLVGVCGVGMTFIMIGGGIDLSVGSVMALAGVSLAVCLKNDLPPPAGIAVAVLLGGLCGLVNALIITGLRVIPFVATLGMFGIARGMARFLADNRIVRLEENPDQLAWMMQPLGSATWLAPAVWVMLAVGILAGVVLNLTVFGRQTIAIGSNETAARLSGIHIVRQKLLLYTLGGLLTGLAGAFLFANTCEGDPTAAAGLELQVIAAVVIGGGSLMGGEGSVLGTLLGALMLTGLVNGCTMAGYQNYVQEIIIGAIIVVAVALDYFRRRSPG
ncbi:MAG TPA: ABC transporter permease [Phycisphaerae bacterium]|nr:ABC transporter permease [Phycisphaerae bacterium]HRY68984.1 ABC transporter permease [Phycisphaerae bacterium]HSA26042.1 ABC transporter permease [Phycisphaerae bacterium]